MENENLIRETRVPFFGEEVVIKFPNIGEFIRIEEYKQFLSDGKYAIMSLGGILSASSALDLVDAISYFYVLVPNFKEKLKVNGLDEVLKLDMEIGAELIRIYREHFAPFYNALYKRTDRMVEERMKKIVDDANAKKNQKPEIPD